MDAYADDCEFSDDFASFGGPGATARFKRNVANLGALLCAFWGVLFCCVKEARGAVEILTVTLPKKTSLLLTPSNLTMSIASSVACIKARTCASM
jgi:hypothetical protein